MQPVGRRGQGRAAYCHAGDCPDNTRAMPERSEIHGFFGFVAPAEGLCEVGPIPRQAMGEAARLLAEAALARARQRYGGDDRAVDLLIGNALLAARCGGRVAAGGLTACAAAIARLRSASYLTMVATAAEAAIDAELVVHDAADHAAGLLAVRREVARRAGLPLARVRPGMPGRAGRSVRTEEE